MTTRGDTVDGPIEPMAGVIVAVLLGLAGFTGWRQVRLLRRLRDAGGLDQHERRFYRSQARRRLLVAGLLVVLAGLFAGSFLSGMERRADAFGDRPAAEGAPREVQPGEREFARFYAAYWASILLILFVVMMVATVDFWAIHRFGNRQMRNLRVARQAMLDQELARLRAERGRPGPPTGLE
jgi:hypothetical protein